MNFPLNSFYTSVHLNIGTTPQAWNIDLGLVIYTVVETELLWVISAGGGF